ncbi:M4 family metallopeptidase [Nonomuraea pusilla]|uniref:Thermolysin metallopeptidase, alpha-helical domain n=1 Tax=Nonomuraea pusilla TaxID=46177 RepID=A0A1H7X0V4_9ACTN|nr:M4 family metallopeptidase [Nonomuraea pusilla]SEM26759.1 Thermolysin metallopeptidase, alpha-helical domain [Nonomuraea pusilla]
MHTPRRRTSTACLALAAAAALLGSGTAAADASSVRATDPVATVFYPNPVQSLGDESLTDDKDRDSAALAAAYRSVTLTDLDGSGTLTGRYVRVKSETGKAVNGSYDFRRDTDQFEQVMGYYWVTTAQHYLQSLGFGSRLRPVNQRQIELRINQYGGDNSFFRDDKANITLGKGGVDDAEDAEVIVHEYGHSVQDGQVSGFGTTLESGAIGEAFGDYLAVAVTSWKTGTPTGTPEACVADWDSVAYTSAVPHCLRRLDGTKHYPEDMAGEVHADGEIWSAALYAIRAELGDRLAGTIIVDAQFDFAPDTTFKAAAQATVASARRHGGTDAAAAVTAAFTARGLL